MWCVCGCVGVCARAHACVRVWYLRVRVSVEMMVWGTVGLFWHTDSWSLLAYGQKYRSLLAHG